MSFRLNRKANLASEFRRHALKELDAAADRLRSGGDIHRTRRRLKQLRALLNLAGGSIAKAQARGLRDAARALAEPRDKAVCLALLTKMERAPGGDASMAPLFQKAQTAVSKRPAKASANTATALRSIEAALPVLAAWAPDVSHQTLERALQRTYRRSRRALAVADKVHSETLVAHTHPATVTPEYLHDLRKRIKMLWAQLQLVRDFRPRLIKERVRDADQLAELLGSEHDLAMLLQRLEHAGVLPVLGPLVERIASRRAELGEAALALAARFLKAKPKKFVDQIFS